MDDPLVIDSGLEAVAVAGLIHLYCQVISIKVEVLIVEAKVLEGV